MLPVLPLRDTVLFPGIATPLTVGRPKTLRAIEAMLGDGLTDPTIFAVAQRQGAEDPGVDDLYAVGILARVTQVQRFGSGLQLTLTCESRATAVRYVERGGVIRAAVVSLDDIPPRADEEPDLVALSHQVREQAMEYGRKRGAPDDVLQQFIGSLTDPAILSNHIAYYLDLPTPEKQELLETLTPASRLKSLTSQLARQIGIADAQERIRGAVQEELGERQREIYLREQLRAIHKELGDLDDVDGLDGLAERVAKAGLPSEVLAEVERDLDRLRRMPRETSLEAQVLIGWLECIADLPWSIRTEDHVDLSEAESILEGDHYGLGEVKDRVLEFLAVRKLRAKRATTDAEAARSLSRGPILLFVGPPGTGKTSIAESIARATRRKYVRVSLGGARDEVDIRGHRRTYVGAMPGRIMQGLRKAGSKNPVFALDEVDKLCASFQGDPSSALLEALDPAQNCAFVDHYLGVPFDLSEVLFVCTANLREPIAAALYDRMEVIDFTGYTADDKIEIAQRYLLPRALSSSGLTASELNVSREALRDVIDGYTREAGVRQLERALGSLARKVARRIASRQTSRAEVVDPEDVHELLGRPRLRPERGLERDTTGVATGMYYTPTGGDIMLVEASIIPGAGELLLTGQLGDVMKESGRAALTYASSHADALGIPSDRLSGHAFHIHVPAGAIPKDGPSAGVAIATALVSALSGTPVRRDVCTTGEISLHGRVLPVGGLKEKVLGAYRAKLSEVVIPRDNAADLDDLPDEVRRALTFHLVDELEEAIAIALTPRASPRIQRAA